jgi:hypothetical protein
MLHDIGATITARGSANTYIVRDILNGHYIGVREGNPLAKPLVFSERDVLPPPPTLVMEKFFNFYPAHPEWTSGLYAKAARARADQDDKIPGDLYRISFWSDGKQKLEKVIGETGVRPNATT